MGCHLAAPSTVTVRLGTCHKTRARATHRGRSTEAEVRDIRAAAVKPESRIRVGDELAKLGRELKLTDEDVEALHFHRDKTPARPVSFE